MSLSCLNCQTSQRGGTDSPSFDPSYGLQARLCCVTLDQRWSGKLSPPHYEKMIRGESSSGRKGGHRRMQSSGPVLVQESASPRLMRSGGMRRDWSFEDLRHRRA